MLRQRKVTKRKATQLNRCSLLCFNFLYGNFATRGKAAQTEQNCLKIESRKGDLYGEFFLSSKNFFGEHVAGVTFLKMKPKNGRFTRAPFFLRCAVCFLNLLLGDLCGGGGPWGVPTGVLGGGFCLWLSSDAEFFLGLIHF